MYAVLPPSPGLVDILRSVLKRLDQDVPGGADDPTVLRFKRHILRSIAQLELQRASLQAPDVLPPQSDAARESHPAAKPLPQEQSPRAPDSVTVLVARGRRRPPEDDDNSSAA